MEKQRKVFNRFIQSLYKWVQSLWTLRTRQLRRKQFSGSDSPKTRHVKVLEEPAEDAIRPIEKPDTDPTDVISVGNYEPKNEAVDEDGQNLTSKRQAKKASTKDTEFAGIANGDHADKVFPQNPTIPISDDPEKPPSDSDPSEDPRSVSDSTPAQPNGDRQDPHDNADDGSSAQPDLDDPALESLEKIEPSEKDALDESLDSAGGQGEKRESKSTLPSFPAPLEPPASDDGEREGIKPSGPRNIPGRRNGSTRSPSRDKDDSSDKSTFRPKPELIFRKADSLQWEVVLSAAEEHGIKEVRHDDEHLEMVNGEYSLPSLAGNLYIIYEDRETDELSLFNGTPLMFKLRNNWSGHGRKVGGLTNGHYIIIVPSCWSRKGHIPVEAAGCTDTGFKAHYFHVTQDSSTDDVGGFAEYDLSLTDSYFELEGCRVYDDSDEGGFFVGAIPKLKTMSGVVWVRIGEEKKDGWSKNFKPTDQPTDQSLAEVLDGRQGRFYIRVYDDDVKLLDSDEFRYLRNLREISVNGEVYTKNTLLVPPYSGGERTELRFIGENGHNIRPIIPQSVTNAKVRQDGAVIVDPDPDADTIPCDLNAGGVNTVRSVVMLPRVWWQIDAGEGIPDKWKDTPLVTTQAKLREYAEADAMIRVRLPRRISSIRVGFGGNPDRTLKTGETDEIRNCRETELQLNRFIDDSELDPNQPLNEDASLDIQFERTVLKLVQIRVDHTPEIISFTSKPSEITIGSKVTLHWKTRSTESCNVYISPEIGRVLPNGSEEITLYETLKFTLRLEAVGFKETAKSVTVKVHPLIDYDGALLTACEIRTLLKLKGVTSESISADLNLTKRYVEDFLNGKYRTGRYQSKDDTVSDIETLYEDMSDYACDPQKYADDAKVRKERRRAITTKRNRDRLLGADS